MRIEVIIADGEVEIGTTIFDLRGSVINDVFEPDNGQKKRNRKLG